MTSANRLQHEKSPYLLQHKDNPVDWYPWGDEAFARARELDRPIFLSIGYATCHWCHVMEKESFEDSTVAELMNKYFVAIKVDREERPDVDEIYMNVCQMMTGSGGWPLTIVMTPEAKPVWAGTYLPTYARYNQPGLVDLLAAIGEKWTTERAQIDSMGVGVVRALAEMTADEAGTMPGEADLERGIAQLTERYDPNFGGFGGPPKFPMPHRLTAAIRWAGRTGDPELLDQITHTMRAMRRGGIYDQIGYGFHRYSTDAQWLVPHFEKMLYDNAGLAIAYTELYQLTGDSEWRAVAEEIFTYVLRDMTSPEGGFYSAEDADSEGREGTFYVWTPRDFTQVLGEELGQLARDFWGVIGRGNFEDNTSILQQTQTIAAFAESQGIDAAACAAKLEDARQRLFALREQREHPLKDDKILTSWNGYMIAALAKAGQAFDRPEYTQAAAHAADFLLESLRREDGRLLRRYRDGDAGILAFSEDYAFAVWGLIELYEATFATRYLDAALKLNRAMLDLFWDDTAGGLFSTGDDAETLILRAKEYNDGAMPSGNSVAALNLLRLARMTGDTDLEEKSYDLLKSFAGNFKRNPVNALQTWWAVDFAVGPSHEIVIAAASDDDAKAFAEEIRSRFMPRKVLLGRIGAQDGLPALAPYTKDLKPVDGRPTVYVCRDFACDLPATSVADLDKRLPAVKRIP